MYGPTETTIWSSVKQVTASDDEITIGKPIANTKFYVLDSQMQLVPVGVVGELFIGGDGVARGYHSQPELTAEMFVPDPFSVIDGARMYRTGDLVRHRRDGELVHVGRSDSQVKVRGFRIELGEIEAALSRHPAVRLAAVIASHDRSRPTRIVAYCVTELESMPSTSDLRRHVRSILPAYMAPHLFVRLDELPLTPNGKIDRARLPEPSTTAAVRTTEVAFRSSIEAEVAALFADVLQVEHVNRDDDFFDLGGDSLSALRLIMSLQQHVPCDLPLHVLYEASTVTALSDLVGDELGTRRSSLGSGTAGSGLSGEARSRTERRIAEIWEGLLDATTTVIRP